MFLTSPRAERDPQAIDHSPVKITAAPPARPDPTLLVDERRLLRQLRGLLERQTQDEPFLEARCKEDLEQLQLAFDTAYQEVIVSFVRRKEELERQVKQNRITIKTKFEGRLVRLETSFETGRGRIREAYRLEKEAAKAEYKETRWTATAMYDGVENQAEKTLKETTQRLEEIKRRLETTRETSLDYLTRCHMPVPEAAVGAESLQPLDLEDLNDFAKDVKADGADLARMKLPAFFRREGIVWLFLGLWLALAYPGFWAAGLLGIAGSGGVALVGAFLGSMVLRVLATGEVKKIAVPLFEHIAHGLLCEQSLRRAAVQEHQRLVRDSREKLAQEVQKAVAAFMKRKQTARDRRSVAWNVLVQETQQRRQATKTRRDRNWKRNENYFRDETASNQSQYEADSKALYEENCRRTTEFETQYASAREEIRRAWDDGMRQVLDGCRQLMAAALENSPPWEATSWEQSTPLAQMPATLSLGTLRLALEHLPRPLPGPDAPTALEMPALLPFPPAGSFLVTAPRDADQAALAVVQQLLMRWLTSAPPGKFRITFVDPLGLGQNFASFMHLADHDEMLVSGRIWTEPAQIEQRLADLSAHMEHVIQKYLRNQYASIEEYNVKAGEVAEPYRLLVISHFPTNFTVDAVRRLASILQSGPRCGVYTLIYFDSDLKLLNELPMAELQRDATCLVWNQDRFVWKDPDFERTTFVPAPPPPEGRILHLLHKVGEAALANKRVQVPFSFVAPAAAARWHTSAAAGLDVAIGRAGATRRQYLRLGQGTAQHALIAGKTGSGKSTLLHALVTNLALTYSPREAELYLIDFKKGVEFKTYATHLLPHARVIAIESEREFGLSVLERLLGEMDRRAELFRKAGVQDLKSFRQLRPAIALPRILLIVDEFQEFFIEEDVLADKAASHLDRLVRQGRAFGLHLVLGSQTLGGAYTLARSTIDQMAVRIALQCSETDGHLILSEENHAARLLSRPGEAIYNDANGLVDGNNPFQVVWLDDDERDTCLEQATQLDQAEKDESRLPPLVFEGAAVADVTANRALERLLRQPAPAGPRGLAFWLGEAIAIKDPTVAYFRPLSGNNLLLLGQNETAVRGLLATTVTSLAAQLRANWDPAAALSTFYILESSPVTEDGAVSLEQVARTLGAPTTVLTRVNLADQMHLLRDEVQRRQEATGKHAPVFLIIHGLQRFRDLRASEDDFSYSRPDPDKPNPAADLSAIVRDGPAVDVHVLVWCDTLANLSRQMERASIKEFELRVLFQMSASDSSVLVDNPKASRLGLYRALFYNQAEDVDEKFRPYGVPPLAWLSAPSGASAN